MNRLLASLLLAVLLLGCDSEEQGPKIDVGVDTTQDTGSEDVAEDTGVEDTGAEDTGEDGDAFVDSEMPYRYLETYGLFEDALAQTPAAGVVPYDVNATLYADESEKLRFLWLPEGGQITFDPTGRWVFPQGAIAIKTFYYPDDAQVPDGPRRLLETRLLIKDGEGWTPHTYVWNEAQTEAVRLSTGSAVEVSRVDAEGASVVTDYVIPNNNQCKNCHEQNRVNLLLGPNTRQLNRDYDHGEGAVNQLEHLAGLGWFDGPLPDVSGLEALADFRDPSMTVVAKARSYLDANCSHCHNPEGSASSSGLNLGFHVDRDVELGVCRRPFAAGPGSGGFTYDIVPGKPEESIMVFRMSSTDPDIKMPELPTTTVDHVGRQVISDWIMEMPPGTCSE